MDGDKVVTAAAVVVVVAVVVDDVTAAKVVDVGALVVVVVVEDVIVCCGDSVRLAAATLFATLSRVSTRAVSAETKDSSVTSPMVDWTVSLTTVALTNLPRAPEVGASGDGERFSGNRLRINRTIPVGVSALLTMGTAVVVVVVVVVVGVVLVASALGLSCALNCSCVDPCLRWITDNRRPNPTDQSSCTRSKSSSSNRSP